MDTLQFVKFVVCWVSCVKSVNEHGDVDRSVDVAFPPSGESGMRPETLCLETVEDSFASFCDVCSEVSACC